MSENRPFNRYWVVVGAILIQLCLGAIYAWSVFTPALKAGSPGSIAGIYVAKQLGMEKAAFEEMNGALKAPRAKLKEVSAKIKGTTDKADLDALKIEQKDFSKQIDEIVTGFISKERIEALSYGFSNAMTQGIFAAGLAAFAVVMVLAGRLMPTL